MRGQATLPEDRMSGPRDGMSNSLALVVYAERRKIMSLYDNRELDELIAWLTGKGPRPENLDPPF